MSSRLLYVCEGGDCTERGSGDLYQEIKEQCESLDPQEERVKVRRYPCFGACECGINVTLFPDRVFYSHVEQADVQELVEHVLGEGKPITRLQGQVPDDVEEIIWEMLDSPY